LYDYLVADEGVGAVVGDRIYYKLLPRDATLPALVIQEISTPRDYDNAGESDLKESRYQVSCWADTAYAADQAANAVVAAVSGYAGTMGDVDIDAIFVVDDGDLDEIEPQAEEQTRHGKRLELEIWHTES
jgi:hypothetical protein